MTRDEVQRIARAAGIHVYSMELCLLVAAHEREACARVAEDERALWRRNDIRDTAAALGVVAAAIRARGGAE